MSITDALVIVLGILTIIKFTLDVFRGKQKDSSEQIKQGAKQNEDIVRLEERFNFIKKELESVNKKLDNHITHISAKLDSVDQSISNILIRLNK